MAGISFDNIRVGSRYRLINYGERYEFVVDKNLGSNNYRFKDIHSLEYYELNDLIRFGKGNDFEIRDLREG
jgi:hypothetical protein